MRGARLVCRTWREAPACTRLNAVSSLSALNVNPLFRKIPKSTNSPFHTFSLTEIGTSLPRSSQTHANIGGCVAKALALSVPIARAGGESTTLAGGRGAATGGTKPARTVLCAGASTTVGHAMLDTSTSTAGAPTLTRYSPGISVAPPPLAPDSTSATSLTPEASCLSLFFRRERRFDEDGDVGVARSRARTFGVARVLGILIAEVHRIEKGGWKRRTLERSWLRATSTPRNCYGVAVKHEHDHEPEQSMTQKEMRIVKRIQGSQIETPLDIQVRPTRSTKPP